MDASPRKDDATLCTYGRDESEAGALPLQVDGQLMGQILGCPRHDTLPLHSSGLLLPARPRE